MPSKSSGSGPMAAVKFISDAPIQVPRGLKLPTVLNDEVAKYNNEHLLGVSDLDAIARMWFQVYHSVVWLGAATNLQTVEEELTGNFVGTRIKDHHHVPAFDETHEGVGLWFYGAMQTLFKDIAQTNNTDQGKRFTDSVLQLTEVGGSNQPLIKQFLDKINAQRLAPGTFDLARVLEACQASTAEMSEANEYHHRARDYALAAIDTLEPLLTLVGENLAEIHSWLTADRGSKTWLSEKLKIAEVAALGAANYDALPDEAKLAIGRSSLILRGISFKIFSLIYGRLEGRDLTDSIDGLEKVINTVTAALGDPARAAWLDLLSATYASIAWHIFRKAEAATIEVRTILQGG
jgi:hypothetical protein